MTGKSVRTHSSCALFLIPHSGQKGGQRQPFSFTITCLASRQSIKHNRRRCIRIMDGIDKKILKTLQDNARASLKAIAENTYLSSPAVSSRIEKLEKEKVITGYHAAVDPMKMGYHIIAFVNLDVAPTDKIKFYEDMRTNTNVLECNCVTGEFSMLVKVAFQSTIELDVYIGQLQKYGRTSTQIVFSTPVGPRGVDVSAELDIDE